MKFNKSGTILAQLILLNWIFLGGFVLEQEEIEHVEILFSKQLNKVLLEGWQSNFFTDRHTYTLEARNFHFCSFYKEKSRKNYARENDLD